MPNVAEFTDEWGISIRAERVPLFSSDSPELIELLIHEDDSVPANFVQLNYQQAAALRDALTDLIG